MDWELERGKKTNGWKNHAKWRQDARFKKVYINSEPHVIPVEVPEEHKELYLQILNKRKASDEASI